MKYYIDTCIWRDLHENRNDKFRPLGEWAFEFFKKVRENKEILIYSDSIIEELSKDYDKKTIKEIFSILSDEKIIQKVEVNKDQIKESIKLKDELKIPFGDILHAILARDNNAIMITRDHHFEELQNIVISKKPEELI